MSDPFEDVSVNWLASELRKEQQRANWEMIAPEPEEEAPMLEVRLQVYPNGEPYLRVGDPQFDLDSGGYWGAGYIAQGDTASELRQLARDLIQQARDQHAESAEYNDWTGP